MQIYTPCEYCTNYTSVLACFCRFSLPRAAVPDGYRDAKLSLLFAGAEEGINIIGEVQVTTLPLFSILTLPCTLISSPPHIYPLPLYLFPVTLLQSISGA